MKPAILILIVAVCFLASCFAGYGLGASYAPPQGSQTGGPANRDVEDYFGSLPAEQNDCVESALGQDVFSDISNGRRLPSPEEFGKIKACTGLKSWPPGGFASLPSDYEEYTWEPSWDVNK